MAGDEKQEALAGNAERQALLHQHQLQPQQPSIVRWDRFLPQQQLRVLLVEDDDSTGHVVSALLRNCGYEVTFASNGLLAWEVLMDQTNQVDLVLTEVVMPNLSGIGLLSRIVNHEPLKHIPVIMMSSHDSMGVVFKCLSKGAVDFLVKPVRKNELKNLWQHIWRRCHSSSGSGSGSKSGSGSQTQKGAQPDAAREANNSGSNDESDNMSSELNLDGGSDNGSGTQNSWTKKAVEVESSHHGISGDSRLHSSIQLKGPDCQNRKNDDVSLDTNVAVSRVAAVELTFFHNDQVNGNLAPDMVRITGRNARGTRQCDEGLDNALPHVNLQTANVVNEIPTKEQGRLDEQQADSEDANDLLEKHASNSPSSKDKTLSDSSSPSLLKLSLKRPSQAENDREGEVRGTLKRSCSSAFSRYNSSGNATPLPAGTISSMTNTPANGFGDHSIVHGSSVGSNHPLSTHLSSRIDRPPYTNVGTDEVLASPFFRGTLHGSSNQNSSVARTILSGKQNVASCFAKEEGTYLKAGPGRQIQFLPSSGMPNASGSCKEPPSLADTNLAPHWVLSSENVEVQECHVPHKPIQDHQNTHTNNDVQVHHHHHHHHHHIQHHYHHHKDQLQQTPQQEDSAVINVGASTPKCGSSNKEKCPEDNNGQSGSCNGYGSNGNGAVSLNGSATGSNGGQSAAAEQAGVGNVDSSTQPGAGSGLTAAHGFPHGPDESRHARREAALTKFRRKRKERCFEKKVRYQSRKRLAEQRPRVRGQFVKQSVK